jgi:hypothetical protein
LHSCTHNSDTYIIVVSRTVNEVVCHPSRCAHADAVVIIIVLRFVIAVDIDAVVRTSNRSISSHSGIISILQKTCQVAGRITFFELTYINAALTPQNAIVRNCSIISTHADRSAIAILENVVLDKIVVPDV